MSDLIDQSSDDLKAAPLPVESATRHFVFLPGDGSAQDSEMLQAWLRWGGLTEFVWEVGRAAECGVCLYARGSLGSDNQLAELVWPFFDRHGKEANVFEWDAPAATFHRINPAWLATYYHTPLE